MMEEQRLLTHDPMLGRPAGPEELPPNAELTSDVRRMPERSRPALDWEIQLEAERNTV